MLDWSLHIQTFVQTHRVARLATVDARGQPLVLPICYVLLHGTAEVVNEGPELEQAIAALRTKYPQYRDMPIEHNPMIAIHLTRVVSWGAISRPRPDG